MSNDATDLIIGIDLGTTNSEVALIRAGKVEVLDIENDNKQFPSYVGLDEQGNLLMGEAARNQYILYPERTVKSIKRLMGSDEQVVLGEKHYSPQEISAMILHHLKQVAEQHCGETINRAVITVPAFFSDAQRQATRDAGEIAGLQVERIINEPTAAALAYESGQQNANNILVYDLGGGTFDVSIVQMEQDIVEVRASHGDNNLGGDDFDQKLVEHIQQHLKDKDGVDLSVSPRAQSRVNRAAERAKIALSSQPYYQVEEENLLEHNGKPVHLSLEISRESYEEMIGNFINTTLNAVHIALEGAALRAADIDEILLVGGSTRTPLVWQRLEEELGMPPRQELNPDLCVAMGAAIQAGMLMEGDQPGPILVDVTPYTFGTSAISDLNGMQYPYCFIPLIKKNTPIPVTRSESFFTQFDGQEKIEIKVFQGEDPDAMKNTEIGCYMLEDFGDLVEGSPIITTFSLDINGILQVTTKEKQSGAEQHLIIDNAISRFQVAELEHAKTALQQLMGEGEVSAAASGTHESRNRIKAEAVLEKARHLLPKLEGDDSEDAVDLIEALSTALQNEDTQAVKLAADEMSDLLYYLEPNSGTTS